MSKEDAEELRSDRDRWLARSLELERRLAAIRSAADGRDRPPKLEDPKGRSIRDGRTERDAVLRFAGAMRLKLRKNAHKAHWSCVSAEFLIGRLREELVELERAVGEGGDVRDEAVDVANIAMMIFDNEGA